MEDNLKGLRSANKKIRNLFVIGIIFVNDIVLK
jgi:hypothetical protein